MNSLAQNTKSSMHATLIGDVFELGVGLVDIVTHLISKSDEVKVLDGKIGLGDGFFALNIVVFRLRAVGDFRALHN